MQPRTQADSAGFLVSGAKQKPEDYGYDIAADYAAGLKR